MTACPRCRHENPDDAVLCEQCRTYLGWSRTATPPVNPPVVPTEHPPGPAGGTARGPDAAERPAGGPPHAAATGQVPVRGPHVDDPVRPPAGRAGPPPAEPAGRAQAGSGGRPPAGPAGPPQGRPAPAAPVRAPAPPTRGPGPVRPIPVAPAPPPARAAREPGAGASATTEPRVPGPDHIGVRVVAGPSRIPAQPPAVDRPAPAARRSFDAVQPTDADLVPDHPSDRPSAAARTGTTGTTSYADVVRCPRCRLALPAGRRFCRCGATLVAPTAPAAVDEEEPAREPWHRRLGGGPHGARDFSRRLRAAGDGARARYDRARSAQARLTEATAVLAGLGIAVSLTLPSAAEVRGEALDRLRALDPRGYTLLPVRSAATDPAPPADAPADPQLAVEHAVDRMTGRAWAAAWVQPTEEGLRCRRPGGAAHLVLDLGAPTTVHRIGFHAGMPASSPDRAQQDLPAEVDVRWGVDPGQCATFVLTDDAGLQTFDLPDAREVTTVRVVLATVHERPDATDPRTVALSEVLLLQRTTSLLPGG